MCTCINRRQAMPPAWQVAYLGSSPPPFRLPGARSALQALRSVLRRILALRPDLLHRNCAE